MEVDKNYKLLRIITLCLLISTLLTMMDATKQYIYESASFSKYIKITSTEIKNARAVGGDLIFTHEFGRVVKIREAYNTSVLTEYICEEGGNKRNTKDNWLLEMEGNPLVVTDDIKVEDVNIEKGYTCHANRKFCVNPNGYEICETRRSNDFVVE